MEINAVFEGGGVKGIALAGAVEASEEAGVTFNRVAGASSGAIIASLLAAGYTGAELSRIVRSTSFTSFLKRGRIYNTAYLGPALRVLTKKGLYSGDALEEWVRRLLREKGVVTFGDLPRGKLTVIASDITNGRIAVLPGDLSQYGFAPERFDVARAIRMSCSIPYFFDPVRLRVSGEAARGKAFKEQFVYIVDGGLLSNFPLWLFDEQPGGRFKHPDQRTPTVGYQLVGKITPTPNRITGPFTMLQAMVETMLSAHDERYIEKDKFARTVKIPTLGVSTTQFELPDESSVQLYEAGKEAGAAFFASWRPPGTAYTPASPHKQIPQQAAGPGRLLPHEPQTRINRRTD